MTTTEEAEPKVTLTEAQERRYLALQAARNVLAAKNIWAGSNVQNWDTGDFLALAEWILDTDDELGQVEIGRHWRNGFEEGATSAVNTYRRLTGDGTEKGDEVLAELSVTGNREPLPLLPSFPEEALPNWKPGDSDADTTALPPVPASGFDPEAEAEPADKR